MCIGEHRTLTHIHTQTWCQHIVAKSKELVSLTTDFHAFKYIHSLSFRLVSVSIKGQLRHVFLRTQLTAIYATPNLRMRMTFELFSVYGISKHLFGVSTHGPFKVKFNKSSVPLNAEWLCGGRGVSQQVLLSEMSLCSTILTPSLLLYLKCCYLHIRTSLIFSHFPLSYSNVSRPIHHSHAQTGSKE